MATTDLLQVDSVGDVTVARVARPLWLTGAAAEAVAQQLSALAQGPGRQLLVNLAHVEGLTSLMLGKLTALHKAISADGGRLALCAATATVREILSVVRLTRLIPVYETESEALNSFGAR